MPWRIILAVKKFKEKLTQTPEKCKDAWKVCNKERGLAVCRAIHNIFVVVSLVGALPYRVEKVENGYRKFIPVKGLRKWMVKVVYIFMVLRPFSFALLLFSGKLKLAVGGNLTADCLIWVLNIQIAAVPAIFCYKFARNPTDVAVVYNGLGEIKRYVTQKYFKDKHIFELSRIHLVVVLIITAASAMVGFSLILSIGVLIPLLDTPVSVGYFIAGPYSEIKDGDWLRIGLYWFCSLVQWLYLNYILWALITMLLLMGEGIIGTTILLKNIRSLSPEEISWREKNKIHAKLEILLTIYNNWVGSAAPINLLAGLMFTVCSIITMMKMDLELGFPSPTLIPIFLMFGAGGAIGGGTILGYAEELRANSVGYLKEVEDTITAWGLLEMRRKERVPYVPSGRTFRRRPIGIRLGSFMYMDEGLSTSYLMQIQDNAINYFFMVDLQSHPTWLWKSSGGFFKV